MKKMFALLLMILFLGGCFAQAESAESVYDVLTHLMNGRTFTLTVTAESEAEELANVIAQYGAVTCTLRQENDEILLTAACDGDAYLNATATKDGVRFTMTGPDHELIRFTCKASGESPDDCQVEIDIGYITGPGNVHSLWDSITNEDGKSSREFYFTFSEEEYGMECEGASSTETAEDGSLIITREETGVLTYQEDELGEIIFRSTLTIQ